MKPRVYVLGACVIAASSAACADLLGFKELRQADGGSDGAPGDAAGDVSACNHAHWPDPPDASDPGTANEYDLAVTHVFFNPDGGSTFGYDLDQHCTTDQGSASCKSDTLTIDGVGGTDNQSIQMLGLLSSLYPSLSDQQLNTAIGDGTFTMLIRLFGYRGVPNQPSTTGLSVAVQGSPGIEFGPPKLDGTDRWFVAQEDCLGDSGTNYPSQIEQAYVSNGVLVAPVNGTVTLRIILPAGSLSGPVAVKLRNPVLSGKLVATDAGAFSITDGVFAGRWSVVDMLAAVASLNNNGVALCDSNGGSIFSIVKQKVCPLGDITANGVDDGTASCDAVSVAIGFDAIQAQIATTPQPYPTSTTPCTHDAGACDD